MQSLIPVGSPTFSFTAGTSASAAVPLPNKQSTIEFFNEGPNNAWVAVGTSPTLQATLPSTTAANTCKAVPAGAIVAYSVPVQGLSDGPLYMSAICRTGSAVINVSQAEGS